MKKLILLFLCLLSTTTSIFSQSSPQLINDELNSNLNFELLYPAESDKKLSLVRVEQYFFELSSYSAARFLYVIDNKGGKRKVNFKSPGKNIKEIEIYDETFELLPKVLMNKYSHINKYTYNEALNGFVIELKRGLNYLYVTYESDYNSIPDHDQKLTKSVTVDYKSSEFWDLTNFTQSKIYLSVNKYGLLINDIDFNFIGTFNTNTEKIESVDNIENCKNFNFYKSSKEYYDNLLVWEDTKFPKNAWNFIKVDAPDNFLFDKDVKKGGLKIATQNLEIYKGSTKSSELIQTLQKYSKVNIKKVGRADAIDGMINNWVYVEIQPGNKDFYGNNINRKIEGWCFAGYLRSFMPVSLMEYKEKFLLANQHKYNYNLYRNDDYLYISTDFMQNLIASGNQDLVKDYINFIIPFIDEHDESLKIRQGIDPIICAVENDNKDMVKFIAETSSYFTNYIHNADRGGTQDYTALDYAKNDQMISLLLKLGFKNTINFYDNGWLRKNCVIFNTIQDAENGKGVRGVDGSSISITERIYVFNKKIAKYIVLYKLSDGQKTFYAQTNQVDVDPDL